ncbi:hypothetical protein B0J17DRAFT_92258 [Rhizoctonia solani]|nr:hypothetical protein B0J17DRAFT_92258 [Rhizoctonia solani]
MFRRSRIDASQPWGQSTGYYHVELGMWHGRGDQIPGSEAPQLVCVMLSCKRGVYIMLLWALGLLSSCTRLGALLIVYYIVGHRDIRMPAAQVHYKGRERIVKITNDTPYPYYFCVNSVTSLALDPTRSRPPIAHWTVFLSFVIPAISWLSLATGSR